MYPDEQYTVILKQRIYTVFDVVVLYDPRISRTTS